MPNIERLRATISYIENLPKDGSQPKFKNSHWFRMSYEGIQNLKRLGNEMPLVDFRKFAKAEIDWIPENICNTAACFCGHAAISQGYHPAIENIIYYTDWHVEGMPVWRWGYYFFEVTTLQGDALFAEHNTLKDIIRMVDLLEQEPEASYGELQNCCRYDEED